MTSHFTGTKSEVSNQVVRLFANRRLKAKVANGKLARKSHGDPCSRSRVTVVTPERVRAERQNRQRDRQTDEADRTIDASPRDLADKAAVTTAI